MGVLVLLMIYVLNGFVGPTFVRGTLYVFEKERNQKVPAVNYQIRLRDEHLFTNSYGEWVLPIYRGGIPSKVRLRFHRPGGDYIDRYSFTGPWPIWHALSPMEFDLEICDEEPEGKRIRVVDNRSLGSGGDEKAARVIREVEAGEKSPGRCDSGQKRL